MKSWPVGAILSGRLNVLSDVWSHPLNRGSKSRAVLDYAAWNAARFSIDARYVLTMPCGLELIVGRNENFATTVYVHELPDFEEMLFLAHLLRSDDLFVDVGANVGMYSLWASGSTGARSISFEPVPVTFATLRQNIAINALGDKIEARQSAVSNQSGELLMTATKGGMNHLVEGRAAPNEVSVPSARLDDLIAGRKPVAMKIDVEGFEMHVLEGAKKTLAAPSLRAIVIELQDSTLRNFGASKREICTF